MRTTATNYDSAAIAGIAAQPIPPGTKGIPPHGPAMTVGELAASGIDALGGELPMPLLAIREAALANNIAAMAEYCAQQGALLAPHGKTSMAPQLFARQIDAGAWAITAATPSHLRVYRHFGIQRVFYANQLVEPVAIRWVCEEMRRDPDFELFCLVDSVTGVGRLREILAAMEAPRPLAVLLEVGYQGGRTGVRDEADASAVAAAVAASPQLELVGLECYEGLMPAAEGRSELELIDAWLDSVADLVARLIASNRLPAEPLLSAGGSAYFDRVLAKLGPLSGQLILRSGCYVTQDGGFYAGTSPLAGRAAGEPLLRDALELWSVVLSRPEPGRAIAGFGKRDAPYDMGLPTPLARRAADSAETPLAGAAVVAINDQHAHLELSPSTELEVGDLLRCAVSHPCGAFDRWRAIPLLDADDRIVDAIVTYF